jgi:hypothetical protein
MHTRLSVLCAFTVIKPKILKRGIETMKVTYLEKGVPFDYKRIDHERTVYLYRSWRSGGLLYGYVDRFNIVTIELDSIINVES